jgi:preprotein translocase subunit YajC
MDQILSFFISNANAEQMAPSAGAGAGAAGGGSLSFILIFVVFFVLIYFTVWRPQSKRAKEQKNMLEALNKGDEIMTAGGMLGRIVKIADPYITIAINNNVEIVMQKASIVNILPKGTLKSIEG